MQILSIISIGLFVGVVMGLTGAGGGILAVPALVFAMGWSMQTSTPVALLAVTMGAAFGAIHGLRQKQVRYRAAMLMAAAGMPITALGVRAAHAVPQTLLMGGFALILLVVGARLLRDKRTSDISNAQTCFAKIDPSTGRFDWTLTAVAAITSIGALAGFTAGLLGVGGGFIIVPMLKRFTNASMHIAVATSLLVIALVGAASFTSYLAHGAVIPWMLASIFAGATALGMGVGRAFNRSFSPQAVQTTFAVLLLVVAVYLMLKASGLVVRL